MAPSRIGDTSADELRSENESLRRAVEELTILNDISREIGSLTDLEEVLRRIVDRSIAAVDADEGVITLVDSEAGGTGKTLIRSMATRADRGPFHLNDQVVGWMQLHRQPLRVERGRDRDVLFLGVSDDDVRAFLSVPLLARSRLVGVLTVCNAKNAAGFDDADQRLLSIIGSQSAQIIENARLYEEEKHLRRMEDDLRLAFEIQTRLLPDAPPRIDGYDLAGCTLPAQQVGGDFFDYIPLDSHRTAVCVGDVSGKGLPAALLMASAQATIRGQADPQRPPGESVARVNWQLYRSIRRGSFLTLFYAELDHERNRLHFVNAGHNRPILVRGAETAELRTGGVAIGLMPRAEYEHAELDLEPGDLLLIYSDGLTEALNASGEQFGEQRLPDLLRAQSGKPAARAVEDVVAAIEAFVAGEMRDDMTLIIIVRQ